MKMNGILDVIASLACSYGCYARLFRGLKLIEKHDPEWYNKIANQLEGKKFGSVKDIVMFFGQ